MKIKLEKEKIVRAVKKLTGVEVVLGDADDAREALDLIMRSTDLSEEMSRARLDDIKVTALREFEDSAVAYRVVFLLEFVFEADVSDDRTVSCIKKFQDFFSTI